MPPLRVEGAEAEPWRGLDHGALSLDHDRPRTAMEQEHRLRAIRMARPVPSGQALSSHHVPSRRDDRRSPAGGLERGRGLLEGAGVVGPAVPARAHFAEVHRRAGAGEAVPGGDGAGERPTGHERQYPRPHGAAGEGPEEASSGKHSLFSRVRAPAQGETEAAAGNPPAAAEPIHVPCRRLRAGSRRACATCAPARRGRSRHGPGPTRRRAVWPACGAGSTRTRCRTPPPAPERGPGPPPP